MMSNQSKMRIVLQLIILCLAVLFLYLMYILFPFYKHVLIVVLQVLAPFLIAGLIAYLLHPVVEKIHRFHIPRPLAIIFIYLLFFTLTGYGIYISFPMWMEQLQEMQQNIPQYVDAYRSFIYGLYNQTSFLPEGFHDNLDQLFQNIETTLGEQLTNLLKNIPLLFDIFVMIAVIPILAFYFLKDYQQLQRGILKIIPQKYQSFTKKLAHDMEESLGQYIRGQILVCFLVGLVSYFLLRWIGMNYAVVLATIIGFTNFIPYFGPIIGAIPAVLIAFTMSTKMVLYVFLVVLAVQLLEGNLLSPFIVGKSIHIHPVYLILTLFIAAKTTGVVGMLLAVPFLAVARVAVPLIIRQVKAIDR
ncbi:Predicted PurR-regulated permease PerM [Gracilibacillus orientalis]|uniref:Predicted PurR-regulated permease PerM n=1 Tax=Gracilibacillus orientalis TaxID=334253 RepID=A0A1I4KKX9_9BACI|nr:AI-2E family transporter [Gracilibacillus orientalis]SFL79440.1 Predicted PurR-regulated permease PerM [Gracilibacillus orientalis]